VGLVSVKDIVSYLVQHFADEVLNLPPHPLTISGEDEDIPVPEDGLSDEGLDDEEEEG